MAQTDLQQGSERQLGIIGSTEYVSVGNIEKVPAKIDTGADSSSLWASNIEVREDGVLTYTLFAPQSPYYTGEVLESKEYSVSVIRSSNGNEQIRYRIKIPIEIGGHTVKASLTLADRSRNHFPMLIGRRTISGRFLVDVSVSNVEHPPKNPKNRPLNRELVENPYKFHQKYINNK